MNSQRETRRRSPVDGPWDDIVQGLVGAAESGRDGDRARTAREPRARRCLFRLMFAARPEAALVALVVIACVLTAVTGMLGALR